MTMWNEPAMREAFEHWMTDNGKYPKAVEKDGQGYYRLMQAHTAWTAWQACWPLARAAIYGAEMAQIEAPLRAEIERLREELECAVQALPEPLRGSVVSVAVATIAAGWREEVVP